MAKNIKPRVYTISRSLGLQNKEILDILVKYNMSAKNHMSTLSEIEMDLIFDYFTQKYDDGSDISEFLSASDGAEDEAAAIDEAADESADAKAPLPEEEASAPRARYVNTRPTVVDLDKLDTAKAESLVPESVIEAEASAKKPRKAPSRGRRRRGAPASDVPAAKPAPPEKDLKPIHLLIADEITVGDLARGLKQQASEIIKRLIELGIMATVNQSIDYDTAALVAEDMGATVEREIIVTDEDRLLKDEPDAEESLQPRPPIVVVMGHVDHGKTSLLDAIRSANVIATEAGGITQHIGAYSVSVNDKKITFLDTPGHEAFTAMRTRGAQVTDIAIIVVAADDGIMPQTIEAINHAKAAGVNIIVAINKIDKEDANQERILQGLTEYGLVPEAWGGDTICVPISAKKRTNIEQLLEMVVLVSEIKELKANPNRMAKGTVIEAELDKGRGPVATVLVQNGTLKLGDILLAGTAIGRIRAMLDDKGRKIKKAGPSIPVEVVGLSEVPESGDVFYAVDDERAARNVAEKRRQKAKEAQLKSSRPVTLDDLFSRIKEGDIKDLNIIVKADVQGSAEAVSESLTKLSGDEVRVNVIHRGAGGITENDVMLAAASGAIVVGFNVRPDSGARAAAELHKVDLRMYRVIYQAIEEIEAALKGMLAPKFKENIIGHAQIRKTFKVSGTGTIAGCYVVDGKIKRNALVRLVRDGVVVHEGSLSSLKRFKDDASEVATGYECGIGLERFNDIKEEDIIECYIMEEVK